MNRQEKNEVRRKAILDAALAEFSAMGYASARMEDIARAAGVAKGTLYLYFQDKDGLFNALLRDVLLAVHARTQEIMDDAGLTLQEKLLRVYEPMMREDSRVTRMIRLSYTEGLRTPELVNTYYRTLLAPLIALQRENMHAVDSEFDGSVFDAFPQLLVSPLIHGILWNGVFGESFRLDLEALYRAYLDIILPMRRGAGPAATPPPGDKGK